MSVEAVVVASIITTQSILSLLVVFLTAVSALKIPSLASWKYWKLDLPELEKKIYLLIIPGSLVMLVLGIFFRDGFGINVSYVAMVILHNLVAYDIMLLNVFLLSAAVCVYNIERGGNVRNGSGSADSLSDFDQISFEIKSIVCLAILSAIVLTLELKLDRFSMQCIWYGASTILILMATISIAFLWVKLKQTAKYAKKELSAGVANTSTSMRFVRSRQVELAMFAGMVTYLTVTVVNLVMMVLAALNPASPAQVWSSDGLSVSVVPEINLLMISSSYFMLSAWILVSAHQKKKNREVVAVPVGQDVSPRTDHGSKSPRANGDAATNRTKSTADEEHNKRESVQSV
jgi:hypothetical protein